MNAKNLVVAVAVVLFGFVSSASAAGWDYTSNLHDSFDLGDIRGGYDTAVITTNGTPPATDLYAYIGGTHKVKNCGVLFHPNYDYVWDDNGNVISQTLDGYRIQMDMDGTISSSLTLTDVGSLNQTNVFNARGLVLSENSWSNVWSNDIPVGLVSDAGSEIRISNFKVQNAGGDYHEYTEGVYDQNGNVVSTQTCFQYNGRWSGDFLSGTLPKGFVVPALSVTASVPEPPTLVLLLVAAVLLLEVKDYLDRQKITRIPTDQRNPKK